MNQTDIIIQDIRRCAVATSEYFVSDILPNLDAEIKGCAQLVQFMYGHPLEIVTKLQQYTQDEQLRFEKYPLIALFTDIPIVTGKYGDYDGTLLEIIICNTTISTRTSEERRQKNFIPILRPLYDKFIQELENSTVFNIQDRQQDMKHECTERYFWGRSGLYNNQGNVFNDYIDAIHIRNMDLKINSSNCY